MTQQLLPILASATIAVLVAFAIALLRSAARADASAMRHEKAARGLGHNNYDGESSSADVRRRSIQPPTDERLAPPAARVDTREPARPASQAGQAGRVSVSRLTGLATSARERQALSDRANR